KRSSPAVMILKSWHACPLVRSAHCASKLLRPASRSPRSAPSPQGRGRRAFSIATGGRSYFGNPRSAISEHPGPGSVVISSAFGRRAAGGRDRGRASRSVAIMTREKARAPHAGYDCFGPAGRAAGHYPRADIPRFVRRHGRFPPVAYRRRHARRHVPRFAFEYMDGGAGADGGIARNWSALDAVELVPRYGVTTALPPVDIELFGRRYSAPIGVAPMGGPSI